MSTESRIRNSNSWISSFRFNYLFSTCLARYTIRLLDLLNARKRLQLYIKSKNFTTGFISIFVSNATQYTFKIYRENSIAFRAIITKARI